MYFGSREILLESSQKLLKLLHACQPTTINLTETSFRQTQDQYPAFETINIFLPKIFMHLVLQYRCKTLDKKKCSLLHKTTFATITNFCQIPILEKIWKHFPWKFQLMKMYILTSSFQQLEGIASQIKDFIGLQHKQTKRNKNL